MKRVLILLVLLFVAGCLTVKSPNCPKCPPCDGESDLVTGGIVYNVSKQSQINETLIPIDEIKHDKQSNNKTDFKSIKEKVDESSVDESKNDLSNLPKKVVREGETVSFPNLKAKDPDGDPITYTFSKPLNKDGEWLTKQGDAGQYEITITASDGTRKTVQKLLLVVESGNRPPRISIADTIKVKEGSMLTLTPKVSDPEDEQLNVTYKGWKTSFPYNISFDDQGEHDITIIATDGMSETKKTVKIIVANQNRPPKFKKLNDVIITEYDKLTVVPLADDPDGDKLSYTYGKPLNARGRWETKPGDAGVYQIKLTVSDGEFLDTQNIKVTVKPYNQPPVLSGVEDIIVDEGETVTLHISAKDPEGDEVSIRYSGWMTSESKKVGYNSQGVHYVTVHAADAFQEINQTFKVTVNNINRPPVFDPGAFD